MKLETLPPSQRLQPAPATRSATVIEFRRPLRPRDRRLPASRDGAEIVDFTVYRLLKAHRANPSAAVEP